MNTTTPVEAPAPASTSQLRILSATEVSKLIGVSTVTIWRYEKEGNFPSRVHIGPHKIGYNSHEVEEWIRNLPRGIGEPCVDSKHQRKVG